MTFPLCRELDECTPKIVRLNNRAIGTGGGGGYCPTPILADQGEKITPTILLYAPKFSDLPTALNHTVIHEMQIRPI